MKALPLLTIFTIFLSACGSIKPAIPDLPVSQINSTPLPESNIDLPINIDLTQVFNDFTAKVPVQFSGEGSAGPAQYRWQVQRAPFNLSLNGGSLNITDVAHFSGGGYLKNPLNGKWVSICSCNADATIGITTGFGLTSNYSLSGKAALTQFDLNTCDLKVLNFDVAPILKSKAIDAVNQQLNGLNQKINQYNFRGLLQPAWQELYQPIKIADIGYIAINPSAVRISQPTGSGNTLTLQAGITAKPVFYLSNPGKMQATSIPDISNSGNGSGFNLNMDLHLDYTQLNALLKNRMSDEKIMSGTNGYIIIKDAEIYGSGNNHLLIKVKFIGKQGVVPYHGLLYFTCIPQYDIASGNFYINDINFDVNTITKLKEGPAAWILNAAVRKYLGNQVHFNIAGQVNGLKEKLNQAINQPAGPHLMLSGSVDSLSLSGILPDKDYILLRVSTSGNLAIKVI